MEFYGSVGDMFEEKNSKICTKILSLDQQIGYNSGNLKYLDVKELEKNCYYNFIRSEFKDERLVYWDMVNNILIKNNKLYLVIQKKKLLKKVNHLYFFMRIIIFI